MRGESHRRLGQYLAQKYMADVPAPYLRAFMLGCIEPDRNPITYLKGSFRHQWLRGHNYRNARRCMRHLSWRLEGKPKLNLLDYYSLGKLIHYTTDAFTYVHNDMFSESLGQHRNYEAALQEHFLAYLRDDPQVEPQDAYSIMAAICGYHREYCRLPRDIRTDTRYALSACCCVLAILFLKPI